MSDSTLSPDEVAEMYDDHSQMSELFSNGFEHLGYWYDETDDASVEEASKRVTRKVVDTLALRAGERVLDAGCGSGATGVQVADEYGVHITGVTISPVEVTNSQARATARGLADRVRFEVEDYHRLSYDDNTFDAAIAIESLMHATDMQKALSELRRVLRPGGRIAIAEMTKVSDAAGAPLPGSREPMTTDAWRKEFEDAGFVIQEWTECARRVFGASGQRFVEHSVNLRERIVELFGQEAFDGMLHMQREAFAPGPENMGYLILCATKPTA